MRRRNIIVIAVIAVVALSGIYFFILRADPSDVSSAASLYVPEETGIAVEAVTAELGVVIPSIKSSGLLRGKKEAVIISETRGVIVKVFKNIGASVNKGDSILSVDSNVAELSMLQADQQFQSAKIDYNSVKRAYDSGNASESEMLRVKSQLAGAEALYKESSNRFENATVKAPFSGFLADLESNLSVGNYISEGIRIGKVIDISSVRVDLFIGDDEVSRISEGASAVIESAGKKLNGKVEAIALSSDRSTGSYRVIVEADNPYGVELRSGFAADVSINEVNNKESIIIPYSAVFELGGESWVYVIKNDRARLKKVQLGVVSGNRQEILSGLTVGDSVIASGFKSLSDGALVIPRFIILSGGSK